ncbi:MAG: hypothetical protein KME32_19930 [Mojavia pulchra JT2-VF2]|jgi:hypothetical protein|uniref:Uncharacterized protein n=1 Tax=Mojavia pulchra JT2-VF2 TaxID=287848 RepID=A0A951UHQ8_9NOST|nr:hypothetical protein [Mojavia pulchra JT2-VF2]
MVRLRAFSLIDDQYKHKNIHICGEAYSDYQGFIEGALRSVQDVLKWIEAQEERENVSRPKTSALAKLTEGIAL